MLKFRISVLASGVVWGSASILMYPANDTHHQMVLILMLAGLTAGGVVSFSADIVSAAGYALTVLLPLLIRLLVTGDGMSVSMSVAVMLYLGFMLVTLRYINNNITENLALRREAVNREDDLRASNEHYQLLLNNSPVGIFHYDKDLIVTYCNNQFAEILHNSVERIVGMDMTVLKDQSILPALRASLGGHISKYEGQIHSKFTDTSETIEMTCAPSRDGDGDVVGGIGIIRDITERIQADAAINKAKQRLQIALEGSQISVWELDTLTNEVWLDEGWSTFLGNPRAETRIPFTKLLTLVHPEDHQSTIDTSIQSLKGELDRYLVEHRVMNTNGEWKWILSRGRVVERDATGRVLRLSGTNTDITERKIIEDEIKSLNELLEQRVAERTAQLEFANKTKDTFLATMSHEIRTPLGGMLGMMELLNLSTLNTEQRNQLKTAQISGKSLLRIVNDILDWSKIEAGKLQLSSHIASIAEMLNGVASTYAQLATDKNINLKVDIDQQLSHEHIFDPQRLSQILNNFTSNAFKFTEQGSVEISAQRLENRNGYETIRFSVKDSGIGLNQEQQNNLFKEYAQATIDTARMYGGTGLGLAICRRLAELMDGTLNVESVTGVGSTFSFTLDLLQVKHDEKRKQQQSITMPDRRQSKLNTIPLTDLYHLTVLIVDDHPINRMLIKQQLKLLGLHVEAAESGTTALSLWKNRNIDLIFADCHMPDMDGYEMTRLIRAIEQQTGKKPIPIIAWTANVLAEETINCKNSGMDDILTKPTEIDELRAMLVKWLR